MTKRITISLPDDVAAYVERSGANNTSGYIADILRRKMRADTFRAQLAERGVVITDEDLDRMRARLAALPKISDERHAERLAWLAQFDRPQRNQA